jgi:N-methylhydantoinase A
MWSVGTDTGGTFTDLVALDDDGRVHVAKTPSTPPDFERGVVDALRAASLDAADIRVLHHGTTVTTNALLERRGARMGLLATKGFRDTLQLRDGSREEYYKVTWDPPAPLVDRPDRIGIPERVDATGDVVVPLDEDEVRRAARLLRRRGVEAVAVAFLHSYANADHERRALDIVREEMPDAYVCASSDVLPEPPEFERTSTTVANAYVGPVLRRYVAKLEGAVRDLGYEGAVLIMHSGGGNMTPDNALRVPIRTATSGPAGGVMAAAAIARAAGRPNAVSLDMGGTSADIATIQEGEPRVTVEQTVEWGLPVGFPCIDLIAIGAGGGSIAWIDDAGAPHVGPQSAGARPGPACYDRGGTEATTTDANLVLGRLRPGSLLGGGMTLREDLAREAVGRFADRLGLDPLDAARGIVRIANEHMAHGIRRTTIKRGLDPREFTLIAFGGAGPMHAAEIARELRVPEVIVPPHPGATSALGLVSVDARHDLLRSHIAPQSDVVPADVEALFAEMEGEGRALLEAEGFAAADMRLERLIDIRYVGQVRALTLPAGDGPFDEAVLEDVAARFHAAYEREFKYAVPELPVELRSVRLAAVGVTAKPSFGGADAGGDAPAGDAEAARVGEQDVAWAEGGARPTPFYDRAKLAPGATFSGPAIVEQYDSTTIVPPRTEVEVDGNGNLVLRVEA